MRIAWKTKPPPLMMLSGTDYYLRRRAIRHHVMQAHRNGYEVIHAGSEREVIDAVSVGATFGLPTLIVVGPQDLSVKTAKSLVTEAPPKISILIEVVGTLNEKKMPSTALVHGAHQAAFDLPAKKKDLEARAIKFAGHETSQLLGQKGLDKKLAQAVVRAVGTDLGMIAYEIAKVTALVRSREGEQKVTVADLRATLRSSAAADMQPLRDALFNADEIGTAKALAKIRKKSVSDPTMLLLRARGGPADLAYQWLRCALLLAKGTDAQSIASSIGAPEWAVSRTIIPAAKRWGKENLMRLVRDLSQADRGVLQGIPAPWVACEAALLRGCRSVANR